MAFVYVCYQTSQFYTTHQESAIVTKTVYLENLSGQRQVKVKKVFVKIFPLASKESSPKNKWHNIVLNNPYQNYIEAMKAPAK